MSQTEYSEEYINSHYQASAQLYIAYYTWHQYQITAELQGRPVLALVCYARQLFILYIAYERNDIGYCLTHRHYYFGRHCPWNIALRRNPRRQRNQQ